MRHALKVQQFNRLIGSRNKVFATEQKKVTIKSAQRKFTNAKRNGKFPERGIFFIPFYRALKANGNWWMFPLSFGLHVTQCGKCCNCHF